MEKEYKLLILKALKTPSESDSIIEQKLLHRIAEVENALENVLNELEFICYYYDINRKPEIIYEAKDILNK